MPASRVAEKSMRCPGGGSRRGGGAPAGRKPRSAMWSASSRTVISTASSETWPWPMWSSSRPGQATTTSTPRRRPETCGPWPTPPKTVREVRPRRAARGVIAASICATSSRVGARISARGAGAAGASCCSPPGGRAAAGRRRRLAGAGAATAEHVAARRGSRAASRPGSGSGSVIPPAARTSTRGAGTPSVPKVGVDTGGLRGSWGRRDSSGRRRRGCSAGRALGRGAAPGVVSRRVASTSQTFAAPRQMAEQHLHPTGPAPTTPHRWAPA